MHTFVSYVIYIYYTTKQLPREQSYMYTNLPGHNPLRMEGV